MNCLKSSISSVLLTLLALCYSQDLPCGSTITASTGVIEYKLNELYNPAENCVWTIRSPNTTFKFIKESSAFAHQVDTVLTIHTFMNDRSHRSGVLGQTNREQTLYIKGNVAVVVFSTSEGNNIAGRGFRLRFEASGTPLNEIVGQDVFLTSETGTLLFPAAFPNGTRPIYENNMITTFVLSPGFMRNTGFRKNLLSIQFPDVSITPDTDISRCGNCKCDVITIYQLVGTELQTIDSYCSFGDLEYQIEAEDLFIIIFTTNGDGRVASGFELYWEMY